jgi:hypothetical protein
METKYRAAVRTEIPIQVLINYDFNYSQVKEVRDLSTEGAFVTTSNREIPEGARVEAVLRYRAKGKTLEHRLPADVVRVDHDGVALKFGRYDDDTYTELVNLIYAYHQQRK